MERKWTEEQKQDIINSYNVIGLSCAEIAKKYSAKPATISKYLKLWGVSIKNRGCTKNRILYHNYFEYIDTREKAYLLGLLFTDGSIIHDDKRSPNISLELSEIDKDILIKFKELINASSALSYRKRANRKNGTYTFSFRSVQVAEDLSKWNIIPNKTYLINQVIIPENYKIDYLRGFIDGDGSIYQDINKSWHINICGHNRNIIQQIAELGNNLIGEKMHAIQVSNNVYRYIWNGQKAIKLAAILYNNCPIAITRKHAKAMAAQEDKRDEDIV